ncbi:MAG: type II toxin-antitoxin system RelE/ParE family toxin [Gammaproteobacteria bacterium]|nr:type II toxin-antitoxin system RelE/ParE family toxin [Gammaproteobacteria bacterium]MDD9883243.1 type II toxin-antitoxin system RelE/ParE family toxin [Gammaproteobacteria bacterium]
MDWTIRYSASFRKQAKKLPRAVVARIDDKLRNTLAKTPHPQIRLKGVEGYEGLWRYRVGEYRVLCRIYDEERVIISVYAAHRSVVYDRIPVDRAHPSIDEIKDEPTEARLRWQQM